MNSATSQDESFQEKPTPPLQNPPTPVTFKQLEFGIPRISSLENSHL